MDTSILSGDCETGLPRGFGFVEMTNAREAIQAIEALNGSVLRGRSLRVDYARPGSNAARAKADISRVWEKREEQGGSAGSEPPSLRLVRSVS